MSSCRCCLVPHPLRLIERFHVAVQTIKLIRQNCSIFENILLDEYNNLERVLSNLTKYFVQYDTLSNGLISNWSRMKIQLNNRLEHVLKFSHKFECLTIKCSIWLKTNSIKSIRSQLKDYKRQFDLFNNHIEQDSCKYNIKTKFLNDFTRFQTNYQQHCLQMDTIEREYMKLCIESFELFSLISSSEDYGKTCSLIDIDETIHEWKEKNRFHISWLPNEHLLQLENDDKPFGQVTSDIDIKADDVCSNHNQDNYAHKSNLSWSFIFAKCHENLSTSSSIHQSIEDSIPSQSTIHTAKPSTINRVRLAVQAIEQNSKRFP